MKVVRCDNCGVLYDKDYAPSEEGTSRAHCPVCKSKEATEVDTSMRVM